MTHIFFLVYLTVGFICGICFFLTIGLNSKIKAPAYHYLCFLVWPLMILGFLAIDMGWDGTFKRKKR